MIAHAHARNALLASLPALSLAGCSSVDIMAERQRVVGLQVSAHLTPGNEYEQIVDSITVTPQRDNRRYLLQVSSGRPDGTFHSLGHVGSWVLDVPPGGEGVPVVINLREWGTPDYSTNDSVPRPAVPGEVNAELGCNSLWVCEMSREFGQAPNGARHVYNSIWFYLEPR
jgi:hypothetical protein